MAAIGRRLVRSNPTWAFACLLLFQICSARAGTIKGRITLPGGGASLANGTLQFRLSQAAAVPGSALVAPLSVSCATSNDGSVVGLPTPLSAPALLAIPGNGTLAAGWYFARWTFQGDSGETLPGPEGSIYLASAGSLQVSAPAAVPTGTAVLGLYVGTSSGHETLQETVTAASVAMLSQPLIAGVAAPATNSTLCDVTFNDQMVPAPTYYVVSLLDGTGSEVAGFPQRWYLAGQLVDVSTLEPLSSNPAVRFPTPVLSNPASSQAQSIASALNLNGFPINNSGNLGPGLLSGYWPGSMPGSGGTLDEWTPNVAISIRRLSIFATTPGAGGSTGAEWDLTDGSNRCRFTGLLAGNSAATSNYAPLGTCDFGAGVPISLVTNGDDHSSQPANLLWTLELTAQ